MTRNAKQRLISAAIIAVAVAVIAVPVVSLIQVSLAGEQHAQIQALSATSLNVPVLLSEGVALEYIPNPSQSDDDSASAVILGDDCDDVSGRITSITNGRVMYEGRLFCAPRAENLVSKITSSPVRYIHWDTIAFSNGMSLHAQEWNSLRDTEQSVYETARKVLDQTLASNPSSVSAEELSWVIRGGRAEGEFMHVTRTSDCDPSPLVFCMTVDNYSYRPPRRGTMYYVVCWNCDPSLPSPETIEDNLLFFKPGEGIALKGGFAFLTRQKALAANRIIDETNN